MKKTILYIIAFVLAFALLSLGGFILFKYLNPDSDVPEQQSSAVVSEISADRFLCEYRVFGGMNDENLILKIERQQDGLLHFTHTKRVFTTGEDVTDTCIVPESVAEKLQEIFEKYGAFDWDELPDKAYEIIDAPTTSLLIELPDKSFSITDEKEVPRSARSIYTDVYNTMKSYAAWEVE